MNWGLRIMIVFGGFVLLIAFMVFKSFRENIDLVSEDYYTMEVQYQKQIDKIAETNALNHKIKWETEGQFFKIIFPSDLSSGVSGKIKFFRPSNASMDFEKEILLNQDNIQMIDKNAFTRGLYKMKVDWQWNGKEYYNEETILF